MSNNPLISVIIRNYNRDLRTTVVPSLINQGKEILEKCIISFVDDGSNNTIDYTEKDLMQTLKDRVRVGQAIKYIPNQGCSYAANVGIDQAIALSNRIEENCGYITFLDTDDYWQQDYLRQQISALNHYPEAVFSVTASCTLTSPPSSLLERLINFPWITTPSAVVFRRDALESIANPHIFDPSLKICNDRDVYIRLLLRYGLNAYHYLDDSASPLVIRKQDENSLTVRKENQQLWKDERFIIQERYKNYLLPS